jgi:hypothetical protein
MQYRQPPRPALGISTDGRVGAADASLFTTNHRCAMNNFDTLELLAIALVAAFSDDPALELRSPASGLMPAWVRSIPAANTRPYEGGANWR